MFDRMAVSRISKTYELKGHKMNLRPKEHKSDSSVSFSLMMQNDQSEALYALVYQPNITVNGYDPLINAWLASLQRISNSSNANFTWLVQYGVSFCSKVITKTGDTFQTSQNKDANPGDIFNFTFVNNDPQLVFDHNDGSGNITITAAADLPDNYFTTGLSMNGQVAACQVIGPGIKQTWQPHPAYQIALGDYTQGQVADLGQLVGPVNLVFPTADYSAFAEFNAGNWSIKYSPTK
jgi:hypothetical protein